LHASYPPQTFLAVAGVLASDDSDGLRILSKFLSAVLADVVAAIVATASV
jgi:hypothetical protein